jgi:hypothetical protein
LAHCHTAAKVPSSADDYFFMRKASRYALVFCKIRIGNVGGGAWSGIARHFGKVTVVLAYRITSTKIARVARNCHTLASEAGYGFGAVKVGVGHFRWRAHFSEAGHFAKAA